MSEPVQCSRVQFKSLRRLQVFLHHNKVFLHHYKVFGVIILRQFRGPNLRHVQNFQTRYVKQKNPKDIRTFFGHFDRMGLKKFNYSQKNSVNNRQMTKKKLASNTTQRNIAVVTNR